MCQARKRCFFELLSYTDTSPRPPEFGGQPCKQASPPAPFTRAMPPICLPGPILALMCGWRERATDRALMSSGRSVSLMPWGSQQPGERKGEGWLQSGTEGSTHGH